MKFQEQLKKTEKDAKKKLKETEAITLRMKIEHATALERIKEELEAKHSKDQDQLNCMYAEKISVLQENADEVLNKAHKDIVKELGEYA